MSDQLPPPTPKGLKSPDPRAPASAFDLGLLAADLSIVLGRVTLALKALKTGDFETLDQQVKVLDEKAEVLWKQFDKISERYKA